MSKPLRPKVRITLSKRGHYCISRYSRNGLGVDMAYGFKSIAECMRAISKGGRLQFWGSRR